MKNVAFGKTSWMVVFVILALGNRVGASTFEVGVDDAVDLPNCAPLGPSPASGSWTNNTAGTGSSSAEASSSGTGLTGSTQATSTGTLGSSNTNFACFESRMFIDDLIFTGPGSQVSVQVTTTGAGWVTNSGLNATDGVASWYARMQIGEFHGAAVHYHDLKQFSTNIGTPADMAVGTTFTSAVVTLPTGVPNVMELIVAGSAIASDFFAPGSASSSIDFSDGMRFPTSGPVFNLPAGYTANSVSANIVDNQFVLPTPVPAMHAPAMALLVSLLAGAGWSRRAALALR